MSLEKASFNDLFMGLGNAETAILSIAGPGVLKGGRILIRPDQGGTFLQRSFRFYVDGILLADQTLNIVHSEFADDFGLFGAKILKFLGATHTVAIKAPFDLKFNSSFQIKAIFDNEEFDEMQGDLYVERLD
jgi:hypothetical protein